VTAGASTSPSARWPGGSAGGASTSTSTPGPDPALPPTLELDPGVTLHHLVAGPVRPLPKEDVANQLCAFVLAMQRHPTAGTHDLLHGHYWLSGWVGRRLAHRFDTPLVQTFHTLGALKNATLAPGDRPEPPLRLIAEQRVAEDADRIVVLTCDEARLLHRTYGLSGREDRRGARGGRPRPLRPGPVGATRAPRAAVRRPAPAAEGAGRGGPHPRGGAPHPAGRPAAHRRRRVGQRRRDDRPDELRALAAELGVADGLDLEPAIDQAALVSRYQGRRPAGPLTQRDVRAGRARGPGVRHAGGRGRRPGAPGRGRRRRHAGAGHDPADHAAAAVAYLTDPVRAAAAADAGIARARAASWDASVERLLAVYERVVAEHPVRDARPVASALSA
jgi:D-inositol-3-phosphate glycosyltransferase